MDRSTPAASNVAAALAQDKLGTTRVTQFALSAAATLTMVAGLMPTGYAVTGIIGIPAAFVLLGVILLVFCVGYNAMSRRISNAGAFYAYIAQGVSRPAGVAAAWVALFSYNLLQVGLYGIFGATASSLLNPALHINFPWWAWALISWVIVAVLGLAQVEFNGSVLGVLMLCEVAVILIFDVAFVGHPAGGHVSFTTFEPSHLFVPGWGALLVIAISGFVGFESAAFYSEEAKDSRRTIPRATYIVVGLIAVLYCLSAWAMSVATGPDHVVDQANKALQSNGNLVFSLATQDLGSAWGTIGNALLLTSVFAAMISFHTSAARYVFSLGREGVLPSVFGRTLPRTGAPIWGSLAQTIVGFGVILGFAEGGLDPMQNLFYWLGTTGGFGVLCLLAVTSAAVIGYFWRRGGENAWRSVIAPFLALAALLAAVVLAVANFATLLGVAPDSPARWAFPAGFLVVAFGGLIWAAVLRMRRPDVYERIGLGVSAETGRSSALGSEGGSYDRAGSLL